MDKVTFINKIQEIGTCEDDTQRRELLAQLQTECETDYDNMLNLQQQNQSLSTDNENLRSANMKLFLRIGEHEEQKPGQEQQKEKREFKNLFNEKGGIK